MIQVLMHVVGDYVFQNHWLAITKTKNTGIGYLACLIHALLYSLPFLFIGSIEAVAVIFITHFIIDKYRLARYYISLVNWTFDTPTGSPKSSPPYIAVWIMFIVDNVTHVIINYLSLLYL